MTTYRLDCKSWSKLQELWKPEYDILAHFNSDRARGLMYSSDHVTHMAEVQRGYDENYLPASRRIWDEGKRKRRWFG